MRVALVLVLAVAGWGCAASEDTPGAVDSAISAPDSAGKPPTNGIVALDPAQHLIRAAMVRHTTVTG